MVVGPWLIAEVGSGQLQLAADRGLVNSATPWPPITIHSGSTSTCNCTDRCGGSAKSSSITSRRKFFSER